MADPTPQAPLWEGKPDPAPLAWLDDDDRMAGRMPPEGMFVYAAIFLVGTVFSAVAAIRNGESAGYWAGGFVVVLFGGLGSWLLWGGIVRLRWRRRHPGVDPSSTVRSWTDGSAFGSDRRSAGFFRWVLLVLCVLLALLAAASFVATFVGDASRGESATAAWGGRVLLVLLLVLFVAVARADWRRIRELRGRRRTGS
ncbi:hypothetical protein [Lapillicoccus jejuensis]|uniref:Uncharacterized protein n=1 Tax=Lapillicoccus jejuensis TaxID=402171 RepID=A0A542E1T6_9MICO|nr:hypothetical protein [Lapillicoccus jejuensis]TQJ09300.1 hypothetical protein FB458_2410 [Lapillicoccus jejuensis]